METRTDRLAQSLLLFGVFTSLLSLARFGIPYKKPGGTELNTRLKKYKIHPDVIDMNPYLKFIQVQFRQTVFVNMGDKVFPQAIGDPPAQISWTADNNTLHTLLLVDPDWPIKTPPSVNELPHWMVGNIPGKNVEKGETIFEYIGYRATVIDKESHRYTFLVYTQPEKEPIKFDEPRLNKSQVWEREVLKNFSARYIECKYKLIPTAINFFDVDHKTLYEDDYTDMEPVAARQVGAVTSPFKD